MTSLFLRPVFYKSYNGVRIYFGEKVVTAWIRDAIYKGFYEYDECRLLRKYLKHDDVVLEIGAGIGLTSSIVCAKARRSKHIEANGQLIKMISINILMNTNCADNHIIIEGAVTAEDMRDSEVSLHKGKDFWNAALIERDIHGERLNQKSLYIGTLLKEIETNFLIMDVEGYELEILSKNRMPENINKIMLEIHPKAIGESGVGQCITTLKQQGFETADTSGNSLMLLRGK